MPTSDKTRIIISDFSNAGSPNPEKWSLSELMEAIADIGWRDVNPGSWIRIENRIF